MGRDGTHNNNWTTDKKRGKKIYSRIRKGEKKYRKRGNGKTAASSLSLLYRLSSSYIIKKLKFIPIWGWPWPVTPCCHLYRYEGATQRSATARRRLLASTLYNRNNINIKGHARRTPHTQRRRRSSSSTLTKRDVIWGKLKRKEGLLDQGESSQLRIYNPLLEFKRLKREWALNCFLGLGTWDEENEGKVFWLTIVKSSVGLALASDWSADWTDV